MKIYREHEKLQKEIQIIETKGLQNVEDFAANSFMTAAYYGRFALKQLVIIKECDHQLLNLTAQGQIKFQGHMVIAMTLLGNVLELTTGAGVQQMNLTDENEKRLAVAALNLHSVYVSPFKPFVSVILQQVDDYI